MCDSNSDIGTTTYVSFDGIVYLQLKTMDSGCSALWHIWE